MFSATSVVEAPSSKMVNLNCKQSIGVCVSAGQLPDVWECGTLQATAASNNTGVFMVRWPAYSNINSTGNLVFADLQWLKFSLCRSDVEVYPGYGCCYVIKMVVMMAL